MWQDHFLWCLLSEVHQCQHGWEICHNVTLHTEDDGQRLRDHDLHLPGSFSHWSKHLGLEHWLYPPHNLLCCFIQVHGWVKVLNSLKTLPITLLRQCLWKLTSVVDFFIYAGVFFLNWILNQSRLIPIDIMDQFVMAYGGLRGAVAYGLAAMLDEKKIPEKNLMLGTTLIVVYFTVILQVGPFNHSFWP